MITIDCIGHVEVAGGLVKAAKAIERQTPSTLMACGFMLERRMKQIVIEKDIIDTGNMLNSIHTKKLGSDTVEVGPHTDYAIYQEYGTVKMAARPFVRPSLEDERQPMEDMVGGQVLAIIVAAIP